LKKRTKKLLILRMFYVAGEIPYRASGEGRKSLLGPAGRAPPFLQKRPCSLCLLSERIFKRVGGPELDNLIQIFARLPGLGQRSARRIVLKLLQSPETRLVPLARALAEAARTVRACNECGNLDSRNPCSVCTDPNRDRSIVCVVEGVGDLWALERARVYDGLYHVLGGTLSALSGTGPEDLNIAALLSRVANGGVQEIILALSATVDGATTAHFLSDRLGRANVKITRVAQGVPIGGALDVLDDGTLATALMARR
jgi:recombination protein RecR